MLTNDELEKAMLFMQAIPMEEARKKPGKDIAFHCPICGSECTVCCAKSNLHFAASCEKCGIRVCE